MQIKTTTNFHFIPVKMDIIKSKKKKKVISDSVDLEKRKHLTTIGGSVLAQPLWKIVQRFFKILKVELPCDPEIPHLAT